MKIFSGNFAVFDDLGQKAFSNSFTAMNRYDCASAVMVPEEMMTAFYPDFLESGILKYLNQSFASKRGKFTHTETASRWTPMNSF